MEDSDDVTSKNSVDPHCCPDPDLRPGLGTDTSEASTAAAAAAAATTTTAAITTMRSCL